MLLLYFLSFAQAVVMTHANIFATVSSLVTIVPELGEDDVYLAYLPIADILELVVEVWISTSYSGLRKYFSLKGILFLFYFSYDKLNLQLLVLAYNCSCWGCYRIWISFDSN